MHKRAQALAATTLAIGLSLAACGGDDQTAVVPLVSTPGTSLEATPESTSSIDAEPTEAEVRASSPGGSVRDPLSSIVGGRSSLATFRTALGATGITTLDRSGPFTVFAPTNDAFTKLGTRLDALLGTTATGQLEELLSFHMVEGEYKADDLTDGTLLRTLQGGRLRVQVKGGEVTLKNANGSTAVVETDVAAKNGVLHEVDTVLEPRD